MVVVDTGSDDDTAALAEAAGAEVYHHPWPGHFSAARNLSLAYAKNDWILILDGDELLNLDTLGHLHPNAVKNLKSDALEFEIVNFLSDDAQPSNAHFQRQIRLFRRHDHHGYEGLIHNQLVNRQTQAPLSSEFLPIQVLHYGYTPTVWADQNKAARLSMLEAAVEADPNSLFCHYNLANHLKILGEPARALTHYQKCFAGDHTVEWVKLSFPSAAFCANQTGDYQLAIDCCDIILKSHPFMADAFLRKAEALLNLRQPARVVELLRPIVGHPKLWAMKQQAMEFSLPYRLGLALHQTGAHGEAIQYFEDIAPNTNDVTVFTHLCLCALHIGQIERARSAYHRGQVVDASDPDWTQLRQVFINNGLSL